MDKYLLLRVRILNVIIALLLIFSFSDDFVRGFRDGFKDAEAEKDATGTISHFYVTLRPTESMKAIDVTTVKGADASMRISEGEVVVQSKEVSINKLLRDMLVMLVGIVIIVWLVVLISKITNSLSKGNLLTAININRIRKVAFLLLAMEMLNIAIQYMDRSYLRSLIQIDGYKLVIDVSYTQIIVSLVLLLFAEVLVVANRIREEQELTI